MSRALLTNERSDEVRITIYVILTPHYQSSLNTLLIDQIFSTLTCQLLKILFISFYYSNNFDMIFILYISFPAFLHPIFLVYYFRNEEKYTQHVLLF